MFEHAITWTTQHGIQEKELLAVKINMKSSVLTVPAVGFQEVEVRLELLDFFCHFCLKSPRKGCQWFNCCAFDADAEAEIVVGMIHEYLVIMVLE